MGGAAKYTSRAATAALPATNAARMPAAAAMSPPRVAPIGIAP